jgi:hypothetical protein
MTDRLTKFAQDFINWREGPEAPEVLFEEGAKLINQAREIVKTDNRQERLEAISDELTNIANSYAGEATGTAACELHGAAGRVWNAVRMLKDGITLEDKVKLAEEWCDKQPFPMNERQREFVTHLLTK